MINSKMISQFKMITNENKFILQASKNKPKQSPLYKFKSIRPAHGCNALEFIHSTPTFEIHLKFFRK